jgi:hypothetical protein
MLLAVDNEQLRYRSYHPDHFIPVLFDQNNVGFVVALSRKVLPFAKSPPTGKAIQPVSRLSGTQIG